MRNHYSIIIPTYQEASCIMSLVTQIHRLDRAAQIIVVDAGSQDGTPALAQKAGAEIYHSLRGRGVQCGLGARLADGDILLFLHADSILSNHAFEVLDKYFANPKCQIARFRIVFDQSHWLLKLYSWCSLFDSVWTRFGDQGIIVRRQFYERLGGFREWPLMEDVDFFRRARALTPIQLLPAEITTSARKFVKNGLFRRQVINSFLLMRYLCGDSPEKLFKLYYDSPLETDTP